jgi:hypothetical protein
MKMVFVFDNSSPRPVLVAERQGGEDAVVNSKLIWPKILRSPW